MMLAPLQLDDLDWRTMVDAIRSRIAGVSQEQWTLHAPVDPGVTLLEMFAHLLEQRVYWLDQVSDPLITALVALLGAQPRPARAATTLLEVTSPQLALPRGLVFERLERDLPVRLATAADLATLAVERIDVRSPFGSAAAAASSRPRWAMQPLTLLPADRSAAEAELTLWLRAPPAREQRGARVALLLELDAPASIPAGWAVDAVDDVPPAAQIEWWLRAPGMPSPVRLAAEAVEDGTQGLRRSGVVRFALPEHEPAAEAASGELLPLRVRLRTGDAAFSAPPRLRRVVPNVVPAAHAVPVTVPWEALEKQLRDWLPLPGIEIALADPSPPLESSVELRLLGRDGVWREWRPTADLARHGPADPVVLVDRKANALRFGDGLTGRLPVLAAGGGVKAELRYLAGGGESATLGAHLGWIAAAPEPVEAINPVAVRGGAESETPAAARDRVSASLHEPFRAVTAADYEALAAGVPGLAIARAHAAVGTHPSFPCARVPGAITVFLVPDVPRGDGWLDSDRAVTAPQPDPGALQAVARLLEERRLLTAEVFVRGAAYREVDVEAVLAGVPADDAALRRRLRAGLTLYLDPLRGGAEQSGWPFGQSVRPSEIAHQLQRVAGEEADVTEVGVRLADPARPDAPFERCVDLRIEPHELVVLRSLAVRWQARVDAGGGLR